jgi:putative ATP-binding cassette transporter
VHENKESIAFYAGGQRELSILTTALDAFIAAASKHLNWSIGLEAFQEAYEYATIVLPYLVVAPLYFAGEIEYGVVTQARKTPCRPRAWPNLSLV